MFYYHLSKCFQKPIVLVALFLAWPSHVLCCDVTLEAFLRSQPTPAYFTRMSLCLNFLFRFLLVHVFDVGLEIVPVGNLLPALFTGEGLLLAFEVRHVLCCNVTFEALL